MWYELMYGRMRILQTALPAFHGLPPNMADTGLWLVSFKAECDIAAKVSHNGALARQEIALH